MRTLHLAAIAITSACATLASAQAPNAGQTADDGFFRPSGNPNLTAPRPYERAQPVQPARPTESIVAEDRVQAEAQGAAADRAPDPAKVMQWTERQSDRAEREAQEARPGPGTPAPINGAFTGSTDPRDR